MSLNPLDRLREFSYNTVMDVNKFAAPDQGKPGDYGIEGQRANPSLTVGGGVRLAGYGLLGGLASAGVKTLEDAIVSGLEPVIDSAAKVIKGEESFNVTPNLGMMGRGMY